MSRHERSFGVSAGEPLDANEVLRLLRADATKPEAAREEAIACYLAADKGWTEAVKALGGAFAEDQARLKARKPD